ncbi:Fe-S protein assembly co-chaperone HscB [Mucilaginibacter sp. HMF5004]|uniref:Fe-S protein assembly co-chaperone HscB n=1 Tax=Mucilaginibacter rivuli TaxID=2857527 RepID=UPI001C5FD52D|nr:Fe-S protein assembly co-chaperone HscB [Mucilaginibacter rivuli]MBW4889944.1 Fe-S protein assembly co-chaperone HscB [Mucilaginibacter rivuli]
MNYFEFYQLPESFSIDEAALKKKFYAMSKQYHPDFYANESDEKQHEILELSTINNKAYKVLSDPYRRMEYILQEHNLLTGDKYQLAPDFLMEMMEINEAMTEADDAAQLNTIKTQITDSEAELNSKLASAISNYQSTDDAGRQKLLESIRDIYYRQKYLLRIKDTLNTFAAR